MSNSSSPPCLLNPTHPLRLHPVPDSPVNSQRACPTMQKTATTARAAPATRRLPPDPAEPWGLPDSASLAETPPCGGPTPRDLTHAPRNVVPRWEAGGGSRKERRRRKPRGRREEGPRPRITERGAVSQVRRRREPESRLSQVRSRAGSGRGSGILSRPWAVLSPPAAISLPAARVGLEPQHFLYLGGHCSLFKDAASPKPPRLTLRLPSGFRRANFSQCALQL